MDEKRYIAALIEARQKRADSAMVSEPTAGAIEFLFGREAGINIGLRMAEQMFTDMMKDDKEKDK